MSGLFNAWIQSSRAFRTCACHFHRAYPAHGISSSILISYRQHYFLYINMYGLHNPVSKILMLWFRNKYHAWIVSKPHLFLQETRRNVFISKKKLRYDILLSILYKATKHARYAFCYLCVKRSKVQSSILPHNCDFFSKHFRHRYFKDHILITF